MCNETSIKELLPAYLEEALDDGEKLRVADHLASCPDCRTEAALLRMMVEEPVPGPGDAFWAAMPAKVYRAVQEQKTAKQTFSLSWLRDLIRQPRWSWAATTVGIVLIASLFLIKPAQKEPDGTGQQGYEFADEVVSTGSFNVAELDLDELSTIDSWAGMELASITQEAGQVITTSHLTDLYEELGELNTREAERVIKMIEKQSKEG